MSLEADLILRAYVGSFDSKGKRLRIQKGSSYEDLVSVCARKFGLSRSDVESIEDMEQCQIDEVGVLEKGEKILLVLRKEASEVGAPVGDQSTQSEAVAVLDKPKEARGNSTTPIIEEAALQRGSSHSFSYKYVAILTSTEPSFRRRRL